MSNTTKSVAKLAVFGNPIAHSKSPVIHQAFAKQLGLAVEYTKILVPLDGFTKSVNDFFAAGGVGANVTLPFKQQAYELCQQLTQRAEVAAAVNTLWYDNGQLHGDNTDGIGLVTDMQVNLGWSLAGKRALILGAGGAVRGILQPLVTAGITDISVANRSWSRVKQLAVDMQQHDIAITPLTLNELVAPQDNSGYGLVINAISAGLSGDMPSLPTKLSTDDCCCYDLVYRDGGTPFIRAVAASGCRQTADGMGMLVEQAAASFERWLGKAPTTKQLIASLR